MWPLVWGRGGGDVRRCGPSWGSKGIGSSFSDRSTVRDCVAHPHGGAPSAMFAFPGRIAMAQPRFRTLTGLVGFLTDSGAHDRCTCPAATLYYTPFSPIFFLFFLSSRVLPLLGTSRSFSMRLCDSVWFAERYHGERLAGNVRPVQDGGDPRRSANSAAKVRRTRSRGSSPHGQKTGVESASQVSESDAYTFNAEPL